MNKATKLVLLIITAGLVVYLIDFFSGDGQSPPPSAAHDIELKQYKIQIDSISRRKWDKPLYEQIKRKLAIDLSQHILKKDDYATFENNLNISYARSMVISFYDWKNTNCGINTDDLYNEIKGISSIKNCDIILKESLSTFGTYYAILALPGRGDSFLREEFSVNKYQQLKNEVEVLCNNAEISNCPKVIDIKNREISKLDDFADFANDFISIFNMYERNKTKLIWVTKFSNFCPENNNEIGKYNYYYTLMKSNKLCH